jgi:hypothetical protein
MVRELIKTRRAVIANGTSFSTAIDLGDSQLSAVWMPAAWTAASVTFEVSLDGATWRNLYFGAGVLTVAAAGGAAANLTFSVARDPFIGWRYVRIRSGTVASPVNQLAERELFVQTRVVW